MRARESSPTQDENVQRLYGGRGRPIRTRQLEGECAADERRLTKKLTTIGHMVAPAGFGHCNVGRRRRATSTAFDICKASSRRNKWAASGRAHHHLPSALGQHDLEKCLDHARLEMRPRLALQLGDHALTLPCATIRPSVG